MLLRELYDKAIEVAILNDPRGSEAVRKELELKKKDYDALKPEEKEYFDLEGLRNPYADSRILVGSGAEEVLTAMVGIDIEVGEVLLAEALGRRGQMPDLIIAHHPEGRPYASLYEVMGMQADILHKMGVPINIAEGLLDKRMKDVERKLMPVNHQRAVDAARLLSIPLMCLHTPADNMVATFLEKLFEEKKPERLSDVMDILKAIPEYQTASREGVGPNILIGSKKRRAGKIFVDMTGGTGGPEKVFESLANSGVGTIVGMHIGEEHKKEAEKFHINVVIAGHISSDNLGVNLLLDACAGGVKIIEASGFRRVSRS